MFLKPSLVVTIVATLHPCSAQIFYPKEEKTDYTILWKSGQYSLAIDQLENRLGEGRIPFRERRDLADLYFIVGQINDATETLNHLLTRSPSPLNAVRLAEVYRSCGKIGLSNRALEQAVRQATSPYGRSSFSEESTHALARIAELSGGNPKQILSLHFKVLHERRPLYVPGFVGAGDLAFRNRGYSLAAGYYQRALDLEKDNQEAMAGLAECYARSGDPRLEGVLTRLLEINPNQFRAKIIQVERLLDLGKSKEAHEIIDSALAINPNHTAHLSLKAAAFFLEDKLLEMAQVQAEVLTINPYASEAYRIPGQVASRRYRFAEAAALQRQALKINPEDQEAAVRLAFDLLRSGDEQEGGPILEAAFEKDPFNVQAYNLLEVLDSLKQFETIQRGSFKIQLPELESKTILSDMLQLLEEAKEKYERDYRVDLETPIHVQMFKDHDEFMVRSIGLPGNAGHLGICFGALITMDSPRARPPGSTNWRSVLWHEFVHTITLQKTGNRIPRWLSEGISVYEEKAGADNWGQMLQPDFKPIIEKDPWPTIDTLEHYFTQPKTALHLMVGYFFAGEFIHFYVEAFGKDALVTVLDAIAVGTEAETALVEASGVEKETFDSKFEAYLKDRCKNLKNLPSPPPEDGTIAAIFQPVLDLLKSTPSPFQEAVEKGEEAMNEKNWNLAEEAFREAHDLFPEYTQADAPLRRLARVYEASGEHRKRMDTLFEIVGWDPTALEECQRLVSLLEDEERWEEVVEIADLAFAIQPFDVPLKKTQLEAFQAIGDSERTLETLDQLLVLDKINSVDYRLDRARLLEETSQIDLAKREVVEVLEDMPHFWEAQSLLLSIVEKSESMEVGVE